MIEIYFNSKDPIIDWLKSGAPMPPGGEFTHFGNSERPLRKPQFEIADRPRYAEHLRRHEYNPTLFSSHFNVMPFVSDRVTCDLTFFPFEGRSEKKNAEHEAALLALAEPLLQQFDARGAVYGFAAETKERFHYNLYKWPARSLPGRFNTAPMGKDISRYVPGVYWMNFFSNAYARDRQVDIEMAADALGGELVRCENGLIWRVYPDHREWRDHAPRISEFVKNDERFFSLSSVPAIPKGLSLREESDFRRDHWAR